MDAVAFTEYGAFTRHVDLLCFSIESKVWRAETAGLIERLASGAADSALMLDRVVRTSEDLASQHAAALVEAERARALSASLISDVSSVQAGLAEYRTSVERTISQTQSSYSSVADVLGRLAAYQQILLSVQGTLYSNLLYVQSGAFYASTGLLVWALTASPRTSVARPWLYLALIAALAAEFWVIRHWSVIAQASHSFGGPGAFAVPPLVGAGGAGGGGALPTAGGGVSGALPAGAASAAGSDGSWLDALRRYALGALSRGLTWLGSESKRSLLDPMLLSLSWDAASLEAWDSAAACWGVRLLYCGYALGLVLYCALSYTDYSRASYHMLAKLQGEVDRLAAAQRHQQQRLAAEADDDDDDDGDGEGGDDDGAVAHAALRQPPARAQRAGRGVAARLADGTDDDDDDASGDPDWDPADPDDLGGTGNAYAAMARHGGASWLRATAVPQRGGSGHPAASPPPAGGHAAAGQQQLAAVGALQPYYPGAGTGLVAAPAAAAAPSSLARYFGGGGAAAGGAGALAAGGPRWGAASGPAYDYDLRRLRPDARVNPLVAVEPPAAFERAVHLSWLASVAARMEEEEEEEHEKGGAEEDDEDMGAAAAAEEEEEEEGEAGSDAASEGGLVTSAWSVSDDDDHVLRGEGSGGDDDNADSDSWGDAGVAAGGGLAGGRALTDAGHEELAAGREEEEAGGARERWAGHSGGAGAMPLPLASPTTTAAGLRRASTASRRTRASLLLSGGGEAGPGGGGTAHKRGRGAAEPLPEGASPRKVARGAVGKRLSLAAGGNSSIQ